MLSQPSISHNFLPLLFSYFSLFLPPFCVTATLGLSLLPLSLVQTIIIWPLLEGGAFSWKKLERERRGEAIIIELMVVLCTSTSMYYVLYTYALLIPTNMGDQRELLHVSILALSLQKSCTQSFIFDGYLCRVDGCSVVFC